MHFLSPQRRGRLGPVPPSAHLRFSFGDAFLVMAILGRHGVAILCGTPGAGLSVRICKSIWPAPAGGARRLSGGRCLPCMPSAGPHPRWVDSFTSSNYLAGATDQEAALRWTRLRPLVASATPLWPLTRCPLAKRKAPVVLFPYIPPQGWQQAVLPCFRPSSPKRDHRARWPLPGSANGRHLLLRTPTGCFGGYAGPGRATLAAASADPAAVTPAPGQRIRDPSTAQKLRLRSPESGSTQRSFGA